jgi:hypothetical protein
MLKYIKNNQKKVMAFVGVFLMISFAVTTGSYNKSVASDHPIGTLYNGKTTLGSREYQAYNSQWRYLKDRLGTVSLAAVMGGIDRVDENLFIQALTDPQTIEMVRQLAEIRQRNPMLFFSFIQQRPDLGAIYNAFNAGYPILAEIDANEDLYPVLVKEAQAMGVGVNGDTIESILVRRGITKDTDSDTYESMQGALRTLMMVNNAAARAASAVSKISRPEAQNLLASQHQEISVNVIEFAAKDYLDKVPAPTPQRLQEQFDKYKNQLAGEGAMSFGYKYPNRVQYDAIVIKKDEVKKAVGPVELEELYKYYLRNKNSREFITDKPASTRPEDQFTLDRGPTTRPMSFDEAKERITLKLTNQRVDEFTNKIRDSVRDIMKADYEAYKSATGGATRPTTPPPASSLGVPYNSYEYLQKLRDKIQADFKVSATIERQQAWQTTKTLDESMLGKESFATESFLPFTQYMTAAIDSFLSEDQRKKLASLRGDNRPVAVWEPTPVFKDAKDDQLIARATDVSPTHSPASLDEVKDRVTADVKLIGAMEKAKKDAQAALDAALAGKKWIQSIANDQRKTVITTGLFGPSEGGRAAPVSGYDLKGEALQTFVAESFKLLAQAPREGQAIRPASQPSTQPTTRAIAAATTKPAPPPTTASTAPIAFKDHPVGLIELPADAKVVVAEVNELKPSWTKDRQAAWDSGVANRERASTEQLMRALWFRYDNVIARVGYVAKEQKDRKPAQPQPPIDNPFQ